jgi:hypothetical protein
MDLPELAPRAQRRVCFVYNLVTISLNNYVAPIKDSQKCSSDYWNGHFTKTL